ncbi:MAG: DUF3857 domain-containing protein [Bacteroidales bacterium]|nr:DUF3857 domain-containing protein [Bacteroidales bacterium]
MRSSKIRVLKNSGTKWGQIEIPYYYEGNVLETVSDIEATAYNIENGVIAKSQIEPKAIYDEKVNDYWRVKKFAVPNVKEGTVIEFKYTVRSPYLFNLRDWNFQTSIPVVYSEYTTHMIPFYEYTYILQGKSKFDVFDSHEDRGFEQNFAGIKYRDMIYKFGMKDVPAFNDESFITSANDYLLKLDFQLTKVHSPYGGDQDIISTWPNLCNDLLKEPTFGKYCNSVEKSAKTIVSLPEISSMSKIAQLEYIVNFVKKTYSWNQLNGKYASKTLRSFKRKKQVIVLILICISQAFCGVLE